MRELSLFAVVVLSLFAARTTIGPTAPPATQAGGIEQLAWISGSWVTEDGDLRTEEHWTAPRAGTMFGVARTMKGERTVFFEFLRIEATPDGITYFASPRGRDPATPFRATAASQEEVVFQNPNHDFPTRIIYSRESDGRLGARIDGHRNGRAASQSWTFEPLAGR